MAVSASGGGSTTFNNLPALSVKKAKKRALKIHGRKNRQRRLSYKPQGQNYSTKLLLTETVYLSDNISIASWLRLMLIMSTGLIYALSITEVFPF